MVARQIQPMDRAAFAYIKAEAEARGIDVADLARMAGINYRTVWGWWKAETPPALSLADISRFLGALGVDGAKAYKAIERLAVTFEESAE